MFLRSAQRKKDGKEHRYWSVVENQRSANGSVHQRSLLYLEELNDSQQAAWAKAIDVFDETSGRMESRSLFPDDRAVPACPGGAALSLRLQDYELSPARQYGACWLACDLWRQLGLDQFWAAKLPVAREGQKQKVMPGTFRFALKKDALKDAELYDGHYLLRTHLSDKEPEYLWKLYMLLVEIEAVFKSFKNDLGIRPIYHQLGSRVTAHIFVCFLAYCLDVTLKQRLQALAPGLTPRTALETLATSQMLDLRLPTSDGRWWEMSRYTKPAPAVELLLARLQLTLPDQPPP